MKFASLLQNAESESCSVVSNSLQLRVLYSPWESPGQNTEVWVATPFSRGSSQPRDWTQVSRIAGGFFFFTSWATGKPKDTGVGNLSLPQWIFQPRNRTRVSCIADGFFTYWATREALAAECWHVTICSSLLLSLFCKVKSTD